MTVLGLGEMPPVGDAPPTVLDKTSPLLVKVPQFTSLKAKCSDWKRSSFSDSLFQIKGFKLTYDHVST